MLPIRQFGVRWPRIRFHLPADGRQQVGERRRREMKQVSRQVGVVPGGPEAAKQQASGVGDGAAQQGARARPAPQPAQGLHGLMEVLERVGGDDEVQLPVTGRARSRSGRRGPADPARRPAPRRRSDGSIPSTCQPRRWSLSRKPPEAQPTSSARPGSRSRGQQLAGAVETQAPLPPLSDRGQPLGGGRGPIGLPVVGPVEVRVAGADASRASVAEKCG